MIRKHTRFGGSVPISQKDWGIEELFKLLRQKGYVTVEDLKIEDVMIEDKPMLAISVYAKYVGKKKCLELEERNK